MVSRSQRDDMPITMWGPVVAKVGKPGFRHILLGLLLGTFVFPILAALLFMSVESQTGTVDNTELTAFFSSDGLGIITSLVGLWLGFLIAALVAARRYPGGFRGLIGWEWSWKDPLIAVVTVVIVQALSLLSASFVSSVTSENSEDLGNTGAFTSVEPGWLLAIGLGVCLLAPITEEIFFRGLVLNVLLARTQTWIAIVVSSLLFGAMHIQGGSFASTVYTVTAITLLGVVLATARHITGRLGTAISIHILFNTVGWIAAVYLVG